MDQPAEHVASLDCSSHSPAVGCCDNRRIEIESAMRPSTVPLALLYRRWVIAARITAAVAVAAVLRAWALAQYLNHLLEPSLTITITITTAAATHEVLVATAISMGVGAGILIPSLTWLYTLFQRAPDPPESKHVTQPK